ncbi:MAG TPA: hypothetical protein VMT16_14060 [Thermoanaerobaculia bacterium]|nr:hypothetical protein [Thermoanaerobaculia bacterium]
MNRSIQYVGFSVSGEAREYVLRMRDFDATWHRFTLVIPTQAFLAHRIPYQDAPDICFRKLQREAAAAVEGMPDSRLVVSDEELVRYRVETTPKRPPRRPPTPAQ